MKRLYIYYLKKDFPKFKIKAEYIDKNILLFNIGGISITLGYDNSIYKDKTRKKFKLSYNVLKKNIKNKLFTKKKNLRF